MGLILSFSSPSAVKYHVLGIRYYIVIRHVGIETNRVQTLDYMVRGVENNYEM